jgi:hypothetical protein
MQAGAAFYQYALSAGALDAFLAETGFHTIDRSYYDVGRGLRDLVGLRGTPIVDEPRNPIAAAPRHDGLSTRTRLERALLDARPTLKLLAHMQIVCARKSKAKASRRRRARMLRRRPVSRRWQGSSGQ